MGTAFLITGPPGAGKTSLIRAVVPELSCRAGGFITEEIREGRLRVGFRVSTLDGRMGILAHTSAVSGPRIGRYRVDVAAFEAVGVAALEAAVSHADLIVVDEIGKMELCSPRFVPALEQALASGKPILGTIRQAPHPWTDAFKHRPMVEVYPLTDKNREDLKQALLSLLRTEVHR